MHSGSAMDVKVCQVVLSELKMRTESLQSPGAHQIEIHTEEVGHFHCLGKAAYEGLEGRSVICIH